MLVLAQEDKPLSNKITMEDVEWLLELVGMTNVPGWQKRIMLNLLNSGPPYELKAARK